MMTEDCDYRLLLRLRNQTIVKGQTDLSTILCTSVWLRPLSATGGTCDHFHYLETVHLFWNSILKIFFITGFEYGSNLFSADQELLSKFRQCSHQSLQNLGACIFFCKTAFTLKSMQRQISFEKIPIRRKSCILCFTKFRFLALIFIPMPTFATGDRSDAQMQMDEN